MGDNHTNHERSDLPLERVDELIASGKKISSRTRKACYPCNKRKVRCDREQHQPCTNCSKRSHPDLCFYEPELAASITETPRKRKLDCQSRDIPSPRLRLESGLQPPVQNSSNKDSPNNLSTRMTEGPIALSTLHNDKDASEDASMATANEFHKNNTDLSTRHESLNASRDSMTALVQDRAYDSPQTESVAIQPLFGLRDTTAPYPFIDSDSQNKWSHIESLLPEQDDILRFFHVWKSVHSPFQIIVDDVDALEIRVCNFIEDLGQKSFQSRVKSLHVSEIQKEFAWLALMLSVLALGTQLSDYSVAQREQISQTYTRNAFELLRLANFLSRPSEAAVQALLLLGIVLQNNLLPDSAWALIGTTIRLAQSLGLDALGNRNSVPGQSEVVKQKLWWAVIWQETLLSMCFGRPSSLYSRLGDPPVAPNADNTGLGLAEAMHAIIKIVGDTLDPSLVSSQKSRVVAAISKIEDLDAKVSSKLMHKAQCRNLGDRLKMSALSIHRNFVASYLLQLAIRESDDLEEKKKLIERCRITSSMAARAFVDFASFSVLPLRFWSYLHNALGSIILRGFLGELDEQTRDLQRDLLNILRKVDKQSGRIGPRALDHHSNALATLEAIYRTSSSKDTESAGRLGRAAESQNQFTLIDQSGTEKESLYDPMIWMQKDGTSVDLDDIWSSYFANPLLQGNEFNFVDLLQPEP